MVFNISPSVLFIKRYCLLRDYQTTHFSGLMVFSDLFESSVRFYYFDRIMIHIDLNWRQSQVLQGCLLSIWPKWEMCFILGCKQYVQTSRELIDFYFLSKHNWYAWIWLFTSLHRWEIGIGFWKNVFITSSFKYLWKIGSLSTSKALINIVLTWGFKVFTFISNSRPLRPGILKSESMRRYLSLLMVKCWSAFRGSLKVKTKTPLILQSASRNRSVMSISSSTIPIMLLLIVKNVSWCFYCRGIIIHLFYDGLPLITLCIFPALS